VRIWSFAKGHGTMNDFVLVKDRSGMLHPSSEDVRFLCDRRAGIGADGMLRAVKADSVPEWKGPGDLWFMDYRNADGSIAEMCGNGLRVFVKWLLEEDLVSGDVVDIATRAGLRRALPHHDGTITVTMGSPQWSADEVDLRLDGRQWTGHRVDVGNPHCVVREPNPSALDLAGHLEIDPVAFPYGANVEFVDQVGPDHLRLRVVERGVGETMSCGTGVVAAAWDAANTRAEPHLDGCAYTVDVPGGALTVTFAPDGQAHLTGPAVIVARGEVALPDAR